MKNLLKFIFFVVITSLNVPFVMSMQKDLTGKKRPAPSACEETAPAFKWFRGLFSRSAAGAESSAEEMFQLKIGECSVEIPLSKLEDCGTVKKFWEDRELFAKRLATLRYLQENIDSIAEKLNQTLRECLERIAAGRVRSGIFSFDVVRWELDPWGDKERSHFFNFLKPAIEALLGICERCSDPVFAMEILQRYSCPFVGPKRVNRSCRTPFRTLTMRAFGEAIPLRGGWLVEDALFVEGFDRFISNAFLEKSDLMSRLEHLFAPLGYAAFARGGRHPLFAGLNCLLIFFPADKIAQIKLLRPGDCLASFIKQLNSYSLMNLFSAARKSFQRGDGEAFDCVDFLQEHFEVDEIDLANYLDDLNLVDNQRVLDSLRIIFLNNCSSDVVIHGAVLLGITPDLIKGLLRIAVCLDIPALTDALRPLVLKRVNLGWWRDVLDDYYRVAGVSLLTAIDEKLVNERATRSFSVSDWSRNGSIISRIRSFFDCGFGVNLAALPERAVLDLSHLFLSDLNGLSSLLGTLNILSKTATSLIGSNGDPFRFEINLSANKITTSDAVCGVFSAVLRGGVKKINLSENPLWQSGISLGALRDTFEPILAHGCIILCDKDFCSPDGFWYSDGVSQQLKKRPALIEDHCPILWEDFEEDTKIVRFPCGHYLCDGCANKLVGDAAAKDEDPICPQCRAPFKSTDSKSFTYGEYKKLCLLAVAVNADMER